MKRQAAGAIAPLQRIAVTKAPHRSIVAPVAIARRTGLGDSVVPSECSRPKLKRLRPSGRGVHECACGPKETNGAESQKHLCGASRLRAPPDGRSACHSRYSTRWDVYLKIADRGAHR